MEIQDRLGHDKQIANHHHVKISWRDVKIEKLGQGVSGYVELYQTKLALDRYVVKTYHNREKYETTSEYQKRVLHEYSILRSLQNGHLIEVYKHTISWSGSSVKVYMEAGTADLYQILKLKRIEPMDEKEILCLWKQLCYGVDYLHNTAKICHRDLKPHNLVLDPQTGVLKIIDLATAFEFSRDPETGHCGDHEFEAIGLVGSDSYMAPETVQQFRYDGKKADVWSVGIILIYMLNGRLPWKSARLSDRKYVAYSNHPGPDNCIDLGFATISRFLPAESLPLVSRILKVNPLSRASIREFFEDAWFDKTSVCDDSTCGLDHTILANGVKVNASS